MIKWLFALAVLCAGDAVKAAPESRDRPAELSALPSVLSLEQTLELFRTRGFDLLIADASVQSAEADIRLAGALPNPTATGGIGRAYTWSAKDCAGSGCSRTAYNAQLNEQGALSQVLFGKRGLRVDVAREALNVAQLQRADAQRTLESMVKQQFLQTVLAKNTAEFAQRVQDTSAHTAALFRIKYQNGAVSETDLARIETAELEAEQQVDNAVNDQYNAKVALAFLLGTRGAIPAFDVEAAWLNRAAPAGLEGATYGQLLDLAKEHRPDLQAAASQKRRADLGIALGYRSILPDLALSLNFNQQGQGQQALAPPTFAIGVSMALPVVYQFQGEIARARADLYAQTILYNKVDAQVAFDVGVGFSAFNTARSQVTRMRSKLLARSARALELVNIQYEKGAASLLELLDAQRTYIAINLEYIDNLSDYWRAVFELEEAVAMELKS